MTFYFVVPSPVCVSATLSTGHCCSVVSIFTNLYSEVLATALQVTVATSPVLTCLLFILVYVQDLLVTTVLYSCSVSGQCDCVSSFTNTTSADRSVILSSPVAPSKTIVRLILSTIRPSADAADLSIVFYT